MDCAEVVDKLKALDDGELGSPEAGRIREHLLVCSQCLEKLGAVQLIKRAVSALPEVPVPEDLCASVMAELSREFSVEFGKNKRKILGIPVPRLRRQRKEKASRPPRGKWKVALGVLLALAIVGAPAGLLARRYFGPRELSVEDILPKQDARGRITPGQVIHEVIYTYFRTDDTTELSGSGRWDHTVTELWEKIGSGEENHGSPRNEFRKIVKDSKGRQIEVAVGDGKTLHVYFPLTAHVYHDDIGPGAEQSSNDREYLVGILTRTDAKSRIVGFAEPGGVDALHIRSKTPGALQDLYLDPTTYRTQQMELFSEIDGRPTRFLKMQRERFWVIEKGKARSDLFQFQAPKKVTHEGAGHLTEFKADRLKGEWPAVGLKKVIARAPFPVYGLVGRRYALESAMLSRVPTSRKPAQITAYLAYRTPEGEVSLEIGTDLVSEGAANLPVSGSALSDVYQAFTLATFLKNGRSAKRTWYAAGYGRTSNLPLIWTTIDGVDLILAGPATRTPAVSRKPLIDELVLAAWQLKPLSKRKR